MEISQIISQSKEIQDWIVEKRRIIHRNPELMYEEFETSKLVQNTLEDLDIPFEKDIAITGVVGTIGNGCLLYTSPSPRDVEESRMPSSA